MTDEEILRAVIAIGADMRKAQRAYFQHRRNDDLVRSKTLERDFDDMSKVVGAGVQLRVIEGRVAGYRKP